MGGSEAECQTSCSGFAPRSEPVWHCEGVERGADVLPTQQTSCPPSKVALKKQSAPSPGESALHEVRLGYYHIDPHTGNPTDLIIAHLVANRNFLSEAVSQFQIEACSFPGVLADGSMAGCLPWLILELRLDFSFPSM